MALGLAEYKARKQAEDERRAQASKPRVQRFALEKDGDSAVVRFAQEIDYDAKNFHEGRGIGFVNVEHTNGDDPKNGWKNRANCSTDTQGACFPCEKVGDYSVEWDARKGWKQKEKFYINVIAGEVREVKYTKPNGEEGTRYFTTDIDKATGDGTVYLVEQSTHNGIYDDLAAYFLEEDLSGTTITDKFFKITRKGSQYNDTSYSVLALKELPKGAKSLDDFELYNVKEDLLVEVPVAQQEAYYYQGMAAPAAAAPVAAAPVAAATSTAAPW